MVTTAPRTTIYGELAHPENIIFGYGDEIDKSYQDILDKKDNAFLKNVKSVRYLETRHYHDLFGVPSRCAVPSVDYGAFLRKFRPHVAQHGV